VGHAGWDPGDDSGIRDDRLRLMFTCCHPALPLEARVALTLRTLAGLTTAEIARAFLVPEATMAKRLVRAKHKIHNAGIPYRVPPAHLLLNARRGCWRSSAAGYPGRPAAPPRPRRGGRRQLPGSPRSLRPPTPSAATSPAAWPRAPARTQAQ
jgi:hypothetical protein